MDLKGAAAAAAAIVLALAAPAAAHGPDSAAAAFDSPAALYEGDVTGALGGVRGVLSERTRRSRRPRGSRPSDPDPDMAPTPPTPQDTFNFLGGKMQEPLPLPAGLEPRAIPDKGYIVEPIADDVYFVTEGSYCTMFVVTSEGVVLVDTPPSFGGNLAAAVAEVTDQPIKYMIYSHSHVDHVGAAGELDPEAVTLVGTPALEDQLIGAGDPRRPVPTKIVPDGGTLAVGGVDIVLKSVKGAHDLGSTIIYLPGRKVLMLVDLVAPGWAPFPFYAFTANPQAHREALQEVLALDFDLYVGGHWDTPAARGDVSRYLEYFNDSVRFMEAAVAEAADFANAVASVPPPLLGNRHLVFSQFQLQAVEACYARLVEKWGEVLGGVDVFGRSHCYIMWKFVYLDGSA